MMPDKVWESSWKPSRGRRAVPVALAVMILLSATMSLAFVYTLDSLAAERQYALNISQTLSELQQSLANEVEKNKACDTVLENYQQLVLSYQQAATCNLTNSTYLLANLTTASVSAPAVMTVSSGGWLATSKYKGVITELSLEMIPGKGRVLVSTDPLMGEVFQDTAILAKETAEKLSGKGMGSFDLIFSISAPAEIPAVDGPSAGAAMCLLVLSLINHQQIRNDISLTGTIEPDGTIGAIGGVAEKAQAAKDAGSAIFYVPEENSKMTVYEQRTITIRGRSDHQTVSKQVSTEEYIETNIGIDVQLVGNIEELLELATL